MLHSRLLLLSAVLLPAGLLLDLPTGRHATVAHAVAPSRVPVVVELFTSEGCSSCPSADALLLELERTQPLPGVEVIALSEHVDYWNRLGWRDPFSAPAFTERQRQYAATFNSGSYTPQAVVGGQRELVGSQRGPLTAAIAEAAKAPHAAIDLSMAPASAAGVIPVQVVIDHVPAAATTRTEVLLAVIEKGLATQVGRGENSGRLLRHPAVVRELRTLGTVATDGTFRAAPLVTLSRQWQSERVELVVLVQQQQSRRMVGAQVLALK